MKGLRAPRGSQRPNLLDVTGEHSRKWLASDLWVRYLEEAFAPSTGLRVE